MTDIYKELNDRRQSRDWRRVHLESDSAAPAGMMVRHKPSRLQWVLRMMGR